MNARSSQIRIFLVISWPEKDVGILTKIFKLRYLPAVNYQLNFLITSLVFFTSFELCNLRGCNNFAIDIGTQFYLVLYL